MLDKSIFKNCIYVQTTLLDRVNFRQDSALESYRTESLDSVSFRREVWVSDKAIPLLTIAKHLPNFTPCAL